MSNAVFPTLPGLMPSVLKVPSFKTALSETDSGREFAVGQQLYARWRYRLQYEVLRAGQGWSEYQQLVGFFLQRRGRFDDFLFSDPDDRLVTTPQVFGTGNGSLKSWPLVRSIGGAVEPVGAVDGTPSVTVGGTATSAYTIDANGVITFTTAPGSGQALAWTGAFYSRVRFLRDESEFERFLKDLYRAGTVEFRSFRP